MSKYFCKGNFYYLTRMNWNKLNWNLPVQKVVITISDDKLFIIFNVKDQRNNSFEKGV